MLCYKIRHGNWSQECLKKCHQFHLAIQGKTKIGWFHGEAKCPVSSKWNKAGGRIGLARNIQLSGKTNFD